MADERDESRPETGGGEPEKPSRRQRRKARAAARRPAWRWGRRVLIGLGVLVAAPVALVALTLLALQFDAVQEKVKSVALDQVNDMFAGTIEVDELDGNFIDSVSLRGVRVKDPAGEVVASVDRASVDFDVWSLLSGRLDLEEVVVEKPWLVLQDEDGALRLAKAFQPTEPSPPPPPPEGPPSTFVIDVRHAVIRDGTVRVAPGAQAMAVHDLQLEGAAQVGAVIRWVEVDLKAGLDNLPVESIHVATSGQLADQDLTLANLAVEAGPHALELAGRVMDLSDPRLDVAIRSGRVHLDALLRGLDRMSAAGAAEAGGAGGSGGPPPVHGDVRFKGVVQGSLSDLFVRFGFYTPGGPLWVKATADLKADPLEYGVTIVTDDLHPGRFVTNVPDDVGADLRLTAEGRGDPMGGGRATADIIATDLKGHAQAPRRVEIHGTVEGGAAEARITAEGPGEQHVEITARAPELPPPTPVSADLALRNVDLDVWGRLLGRDDLGGRVEHLTGKATARLTEQGPEDAHAELSLAAKDLRAAPSPDARVAVGGVDVQVDADWAGGDALPTGTAKATIRDAKAADAAVGRATIDATLGQKDGQPTAKGTISVRSARQGAGTAVRQADARFDVSLRGDGLPQGTIDATVKGVKQGDMSVAEASVGGRVGGAKDEIRFVGPVKARGVELGGGRRVASAEANADVRYDTGTGRLDGTVDLLAEKVKPTPDGSIGRAHANLDVSIDEKGRVRVAGPLGVDDAEFGEDVRVGSVQGDVQLDLVGGKPRGEATFRARGIALPDRNIDDARVHATIDHEGRAKLHVLAKQEGFTLDLQATAELPLGRRRELHARIDQMQITAAGDGFRISPGASVKIDPGRRIVAHDLWVRGMGKLDGQSFGADATIDLKTGEMQGGIDVQTVEMQAWLETIRKLAGVPILPDTALEGQLSANVLLGGTIQNPDVQGSVVLRDADVGPLNRLFADLRFALGPDGLHTEVDAAWAGPKDDEEGGEIGGTIELPLQARVEDGAVHVHIPEDEPLTVNLNATGIDLALLRPVLPRARRNELSGTADVTALLSGTLQEVRGGLHVSATDLSYDTLERGLLEASVQLRKAGTDAKLSLRDQVRGTQPLLLSLEAPENLVAVVQGRREEETVIQRLRRLPFGVTLKLTETRLGELPLLQQLAPGFGDTVAEADFHFEGPLSKPTASGWLRAEDLPLGEVPSDALVRVSTTDGVLDVEGHMSSENEETATLAATIPDLAALVGGTDPRGLLTDERFQFRVTAPWVPLSVLASYSPAAGRLLASLVRDGSLSANVLVRGAAQGPRGYVLAHMSGDHRQRPGELSALAQSIEFSVLLSPAKTEATVLVTQGQDGGFLSVEGGLPRGSTAFTEGELPDLAELPLDLTVKTKEFDVRGLARLAPSLFGPSSGEIVVDLEVGGTIVDPTPRGRILARFDELNLAAAGIEKKDLTITVEVTPDRIHLVPIRLEDKGSFEVALDVETPTYRPAEMTLAGHVSLDDFRLLRRDDMKARATANIALAGTVASPSVKGDVKIHSAYMSPKIGGRDVREIGPPEDVVFVQPGTLELRKEGLADASSEARADIGMTMDLDVKVDVPFRAIHVKNDMLNLFVSGNLNIATEGGALTLEGIIGVDEGKVVFYGREFELDSESRVIFGGSPELNPRLNIIAHYDISEVDLSSIGAEAADDSAITIRVTGTANSPQVKLSSNPSMDDTNIVSIMLTGSPVGGGGENQGETEQQAANLFVGLATGGLTGMLESDLPIDVLKVEGGEQGILDARIKVGKRIARDLLVIYEANLGATEQENQNALRIQYEVTRTFQIETYFGDAGKGGVDLVLRWRW